MYRMVTGFETEQDDQYEMLLRLCRRSLRKRENLEIEIDGRDAEP